MFGVSKEKNQLAIDTIMGKSTDIRFTDRFRHIDRPGSGELSIYAYEFYPTLGVYFAWVYVNHSSICCDERILVGPLPKTLELSYPVFRSFVPVRPGHGIAGIEVNETTFGKWYIKETTSIINIRYWIDDYGGVQFNYNTRATPYLNIGWDTVTADDIPTIFKKMERDFSKSQSFLSNFLHMFPMKDVLTVASPFNELPNRCTSCKHCAVCKDWGQYKDSSYMRELNKMCACYCVMFEDSHEDIF
jgi:hypothetical protein